MTGGAGFIGANLCRVLVERGWSVRVLDDFSTGRASDLPDHPLLRVRQGDVREPRILVEGFHGCEVVFHLAARTSIPLSIEEPLDFYSVNVGGTAAVLEAARRAGVARVVWTSSSSVYGDSEEDLRVEGREGEPLSPYAASKRGAEHACRAHASAYGLDVIGLRPFNVYGPFQRTRGRFGAVVPNLARSLLDGTEPEIFGDGEQVRDLTPVGDVVEALLLAAGHPGPFRGELLNVSGGVGISVRDLLARLRDLTGVREPGEVFLPRRGGEVRSSRACLAKIRARLGWSPGVSLAEGLVSYLSWLGTDRESRGSAGLRSVDSGLPTP